MSTFSGQAQLGGWCGNLREAFKAHELSAERTARLEKLGFVWDPSATAWETMFSALIAYKKAHGDCNVPQGSVTQPKLASWCANQRTLYRARKLAAERATRLEQLGFEWEQQSGRWEQMFSALRAYREAHGNCNVPISVKDELGLGAWCANQRSRYKSGKLDRERAARLEGLGFVWERLNAAWDEMFVALGAYKDAHGDCDVPARWKANPQLAKWTHRQRASYKEKTLDRERKTRLEQLGFSWDPLAARWEEMFKDLLRFKETHGHSNVPGRSRENPRLGQWCQEQRKAGVKGLTKERLNKLKGIGFRFDGSSEG